MYDLIGDIHGHATELHELLDKLGYKRRNGVYRHTDRQAIFLGDFIDRGLECREAIDIARSMVEGGSARAVMGNHEFNAICYHTPDPNNKGEYLRPHSDKNIKQHQATLDQFNDDQRGLSDALDWFKTLPLWLDLGDIRIVHACWDAEKIETLRKHSAVDSQNRLKPGAYHHAATKGHSVYHAAEVLLKGMELKLPNNMTYTDAEGVERGDIRIKWWSAKGGKSWREIAMVQKNVMNDLPDDRGPEPPINVEYHVSGPPVFMGHYWLSGPPAPLAPNVVCVDYSVAKTKGALVAYRWHGEQVLSGAKFLSVAKRGN
jgi:Calcineurin-like phosphoesterase